MRVILVSFYIFFERGTLDYPLFTPDGTGVEKWCIERTIDVPITITWQQTRKHLKRIIEMLWLPHPRFQGALAQQPYGQWRISFGIRANGGTLDEDGVYVWDSNDPITREKMDVREDFACGEPHTEQELWIWLRDEFEPLVKQELKNIAFTDNE